MKILVADDDRFSRLVLCRTLRSWGYDVEEAEDGIAAAKALSRPGGPPLGVIDWMMPGLDGPEVCRRVRMNTAEPYRYLVLLTSRNRPEDIVQGLDSGADEYLSKPFDPMELQARLQTGRRLLALQTQLIDAREALRQQATRDGLTGLLNRTAIFEALEEEVARASRRKTGLGLLIVDLDNFKQINDTLGHQAGDVAIRESGRRMAEVVRSYDRVGRYGGEEFLIVLPDCSKRALLEVGERIRVALASSPVFVDAKPLSITASIGASWALGRTESDVLIRSADDALYAAKDAGRNRVVMTGEHALCPLVAAG